MRVEPKTKGHKTPYDVAEWRLPKQIVGLKDRAGHYQMIPIGDKRPTLKQVND
ncbi:MAG: hypothetical protein NTU69_10185 [Proteobacteria bacterium]|nr:hypothetical protein [Pseudomonadota bacterium]